MASSESSGEKKVEHDLEQLTEEAFKRIGDYLHGELEGSIEDYKLLEKMNKVLSSKHGEMKTATTAIAASTEDLNNKYMNLQQYIDEIDDIEKAVNSLEKTAYQLDSYSKQLESKYKSLEEV